MAQIMNTTEIESALMSLGTAHPELCQRIALLEQTHEGRSCHALRIAKDYDKSKPAALVIGGVHAREWGGPDIVVNFAADILRAYSQGKGLKYGRKIFSASEIKTLVETTTVVIFPCVNPDGVEFSHTQVAMWRKNRNPVSSNGDAGKIGVDLNRNYDFLWDFRTYFHPSAHVNSLASDDPRQDTFHGTAPFSEPETRNVKWLLDNFNCTMFLDLHSFTGDVLYNWGDDQNQGTDPNQNFGNTGFNGKRGVIGDTYREYLSPSDQQIASGVAQAVSDTMKAVRNRPYKPLQAVGLYPTAGSSDDYAFSRHLVNPGLNKTFGFTIEFNFDGDGQNPFLVTSDPQVLDDTMRDVIPGLITFCSAATQTQMLATASAQRELAATAAPRGPAQPAPYRTGTSNEILRLVNAYEDVASVAGQGGKIARDGLLKAIQKTAELAAKSGAPR